MTGSAARPGRAGRGPEAVLRRYALSFPETREDFPWGHRAFKVKGKAFVFMAREKGTLSLSVKLPASGLVALSLPFARPTGYGLGRSGWVTATFGSRDKPPLDVLRRWIEESFRAVAPKKVAALLGAVSDGPSASPPASRRRSAPTPRRRGR